MYRCPITKRVSRPGDKLVRVVALTRPKEYFKRVLNEETREYESVKVADGFEIVKELGLSKEGSETWDSWNGDQKMTFLKSLR